MAASPSPSSDEQFPIGSVLDDRYRIEGVLGTGGMGRVYRAKHTQVGTSVAIKVLHADLNRNREASQRFQREAIASGRLDHPNIVGVLDSGVLEDGALYLVMEVLEGESLGDRLARDQQIHWVEAIDILRGVLHGLRHAHERGVVHRDIKPDNVYLAHKDGEPVVKILDFGIAKLFAGSADDPAQTRAGLTVGTPAYLSPEQAVGGEITPASDLYSASIVLYEMLAGRAPFEDKDPLKMLGAHVGRPPPPLVESAPGIEVPPGLEDILQRGLRKTASERFTTADEYLAALDELSPPGRPFPRAASSPALVLPGAQRPSGAIATPRAEAATTPLPRAITPSPRRAATPPPVPGARPARPATPLPHAGTPSSGATPVPSELAPGDPPAQRAMRAVSLAEVGEPIPLSWIVRSGVLIGLAILGAFVLAIAAHCHGSEPAIGKPAPAAGRSIAPPAAPIPAPAGARAPAPPAARDTQLKALLHDLELGKTCAERKAAVARLVELHDPRAIQPLKRARHRMTGGVLGIGDENANACLKADAERAIEDLGGSLK